MKQKFLLKTMLLLCALVAGVSSAWADDPVLEFNLNELYQNGTKVTAKTVISTSNGTLTFTDEDENFTILLTRNSGNQPGFYTSSGYFRFYSSDTFKLSAADGITISKVVITSNGSNFSLSALDGLDTSKKTWTGSASEVSFTGSGTNKWDKLTITYTTSGGGTPTCVAPTFDPGAGTYNKAQNVVISTTTDDATIYYTLDGTDPTTSSIVYTSAISLSESKTIKAIAVKDGYNNSSVATAAYTIYLPYTVTLADNSATLTEEERGAGVTLPARDALNGYDFVGWSETNVSAETTTAPTIIPAGAYTPADDITLYPVYSKTIGGGGVSHESTSVTISDYATANNWSSGTRYTSIILDENVTASGKDNGNNSKYYSSSPGTWRHYAGDSGEITITTTSGELTSVTLTYTGNTIKYGNNDVISGTAITVSGTSAVFTVSGSSSNSQISAISVNYDISGAGTTYYWSTPVAAAVEMPNVVIAENPFLFSTTATITCTTDGAIIKYSYDGENWNDYSSALTITETKTIYAKAIKDNNESTVAQVTATKNLAKPTVTVSGDLTLDLNGETDVEAGVLSAAVAYEDSPVAGANVTWSSSNTDIATINEATGAVIIKAHGNVTFTATYAGNSDYSEATGTKVVTVVDSKAPGTVARPYTVAEARAAIDAGEGITKVYATGKISQIDSYSSNTISYWISDDGSTTNQMEVYKGKGLNNANFTAVSDLKLGEVVVVYGDLKKYNDTYEFGSGNYLISHIQKVESPAFSPVAGAVVSGTNVTISCATEDATIYYTIDGTDPTTNSSEYSAPIEITAAKTIKAFAVKDGSINSDIVSASYTIAEPCATPTFSVEAGEVSKGTTVTISSVTEGATIYYTTDGTTPTTSSTEYSSAITINSAMTIKAIAAKDGMANSEVASATYTLIDYATLPFAWNNTTTPTGVTNSGVGTYSSAPYLKFDTTGDYIILKMNEAPDELKFDIKGNSFSGGTFKVQYSANGTDYTDLETYTSLSNDIQTETISEIPSTTRYIKWIYTSKSSGNVALGNIKANIFEFITLNASGYATFASAYPVDFSDDSEFSAWQITGVSGNAITFEQITGTVKAGTGVLLKGTASSSINIPVAASGTDISTTNKLVGITTATAIAADEYFGLSGNKFVKVNAGTVKAGKALLPASEIPSSARELQFVFEDETTAIRGIENGQLRMENSFFDLQGRKIAKPTKGLYIKNGKKVFMK